MQWRRVWSVWSVQWGVTLQSLTVGAGGLGVGLKLVFLDSKRCDTHASKGTGKQVVCGGMFTVIEVLKIIAGFKWTETWLARVVTNWPPGGGAANKGMAGGMLAVSFLTPCAHLCNCLWGQVSASMFKLNKYTLNKYLKVKFTAFLSPVFLNTSLNGLRFFEISIDIGDMNHRPFFKERRGDNCEWWMLTMCTDVTYKVSEVETRCEPWAAHCSGDKRLLSSGCSNEKE